MNWLKSISVEFDGMENVFCFVGDVQIGLMDKKGQLEVEVIRARGLTPKPGSKSLPGESVPTIHTIIFISSV